MFGKRLVKDMIDRSAENEKDRRTFLKAAGVAGLGVVGASMLHGSAAFADDSAADGTTAGDARADGAPTDGAVLNFALNLEYLEAEFYSYAVFGYGLTSAMTTGKGHHGMVKGGSKVPFKTKRIQQYAREIAGDEIAHVKFLRAALGDSAVSRPQIDLQNSFTAAARAAGLINSKQTFNPFASEDAFLLGAFLFEDVGVTAYKGAAPLIDNKTYLEAAAGILAVEAYHAGIVRSALYDKGLAAQAAKISDARDSLDGNISSDQPIYLGGTANLVPTDKNGIAYSRSYKRVLNIVYLNPGSTDKGGFYPQGMNGTLRTS